MAGFEDLPIELVCEITRYLDVLSDINSLLQTSSSFRSPCDFILYERIKDQSRNRPHEMLADHPTLLEHGPLEWAAEHDNLDCVRRLLDAGVPAWPCYGILPPIFAAARNGNLQMVKLLFDHDPKMAGGFFSWSNKERSSWRGTPLSFAITHGHDSVVEFLIENGVSLHLRGLIDHWGPLLQPLDQAIAVYPNPFAAKLIIEEKRRRGDLLPVDKLIPMAAGASFDMFTLVLDAVSPPSLEARGFWATVLDKAFTSGDVRTVKFLFEYGVSPDMSSTEHWDPESRSIHGPVYKVSAHGSVSVPANIFTIIAQLPKSHRELLDFLVQQISIEDVVHGSSLHALFCMMSAAATSGDEELLRRLLKADWSQKEPRISEEQWNSSLELFCLCPAVRFDHIGIINILLKHGVTVFWESLVKSSAAMFVAARFGRHTAFKSLLEVARVGDPRDTSSFHNNQSELGRHALFKTLNKNNVSTGLWDEPQELLEQREKIVELILGRGLYATPHDRWFSGSQIIGFCLDIRHKGIPKHLEQYGWLDLGLDEHAFENINHWTCALAKPNPMMIGLFLEKGYDANGNHPITDGAPPLHDQVTLPLCLLANLGDSAYSMADYTAGMNLLLEYGADIERKSPRSGLTPLFDLVSRTPPGNKKNIAARVQVFLENGADPFSSCNGDVSLLEIAVDHKDIETVGVLLKFFDKESVPFEKVKGSFERAMQLSQSLKVKCVLSRWYWRKRNACHAF